MQTLAWYRKRLASMTAGEIAWRVHSLARDWHDRYRISRGILPGAVSREVGSAVLRGARRFFDVPVGAWQHVDRHGRADVWRDRLVERAERLLRHEFTFFGLEHAYLGDPVDWHRDHEAGVAAPRGLAMGIDYRDFQVTGDCKLVWEPNRHQHLVALARAFRVTGDLRFAVEVRRQVDHWMDENPFGYGMNWRSPMELSIRLISWVLAFDLARESGVFEGEFADRLARCVAMHVWEVERKYSRGSSANNHLIGEAAGVFVTCRMLPELPDAAGRAERALRVLNEQIDAQTYPDGCNRELALDYHLFVLQFYLLAGLVARRTGDDLPQRTWQGIERMTAFVAALMEGGDRPPMFGDADDGYVVDLGRGGPHDYAWMVQAGAVLFNRPEWSAAASEPEEGLWWALGQEAFDRYTRLGEPGVQLLASHAFRDSGFYLLQCGHHHSEDRISVLFDCGELGFGSIAAHGHADALGVSVRAFGQDVLVDPGTYDYFTFPSWRNYFRSTAAHNTVSVDGQDQSTMTGLFLWGQRARAACLSWEPGATGGTVTGRHDGYTRLDDPVVHTRRVELDGVSRCVRIADSIDAKGEHDVTVPFHFSEECRLIGRDANRLCFAVQGGAVSLLVDPSLECTVYTGSENPTAGWVSRGYHRRMASTAVVARRRTRGDCSFVSTLEFSKPGAQPA